MLIASVLMIALLISQTFKWPRRLMARVGSWGQKVFAWLNQYRSKLMIGFAAVMLPVVVLRNALDPGNQSAPYLVTPVFMFLFGVGILLAAYLLFRLVLNQKWFAWKFFIGVSLAIGWLCNVYYVQPPATYNLGKLGWTCALATMPVFFILAILASAFGTADEKDEGEHPPREKWISVWSLLLTGIPLAWCYVAINRYDPLVGGETFCGRPRGVPGRPVAKNRERVSAVAASHERTGARSSGLQQAACLGFDSRSS